MLQVMERRARVEAWQSKKRALDEEKERAEEEAAANRKKWNLEDDASDDEAPTAAAGEGALKDGEVDPLDEFMVDVGTKVQADFATLDPQAAASSEVNEQLAKAGIKLEASHLRSSVKGQTPEDEQMDTQELAGRGQGQAHEEMKDALGIVGAGCSAGTGTATAAAVESSPKQSALASGLFERKGSSPIIAAMKAEGSSSNVTLDQVTVKQEPGLGLSMPVQMNLGGAPSAAGGGGAGGKVMAIGRGNVVKKAIAFPSKKALVPVKAENKLGDAGAGAMSILTCDA